MQKDPILRLQKVLIDNQMLDEEAYKQMDKEMREIAIAAMKYADESPWPDPITLEEDVFAP